MTVPTTQVRTEPLLADGSNRTWDFPFAFQDAGEIQLRVYDLLDAETIVTTGFIVTSPAETGGSVTFPISPAPAVLAGYHVIVERVPLGTQDRDIGNQGAFLPATHEAAFDHAVMLAQQALDMLSRVPFVGVYPVHGASSLKLPPLLAGHALAWGNDGFENSELSLDDFNTIQSNASAAAQTALAMAASAAASSAAAARVLQLVGSGGIVDAASLVSYTGEVPDVNSVQDALDALQIALTALTDAYNAHTHTFASLTSKPTTRDGYGITDVDRSGYITGVAFKAASFTLAAGDLGKALRSNNGATEVVVTVPNDADGGWGADGVLGEYVILNRGAAGDFTVLAGSGATVLSAGGFLKVSAQYAQAVLYRHAANVWTLAGNLKA